jgi:hypothetical protein
LKEVIQLQENLAVEPIRVPVWTWLVVAVALLTVYAVAMENGAVLARSSTVLHEFFHDARHFVGVPCH